MITNSSYRHQSPESQGVSSASIQAFLNAVEQQRLDVHSFVYMRHGNVIAEGWWKPYASHLPHLMFSVSKSFTATAVGLAAAEGYFSLDDSILSLWPTYATSAVQTNMAGVTIRHLLSMSTGHAEDTMVRMRNDWDGDWIRIFFDTPVIHTPGTHFLYNSGASFMLSALVQLVTGQTVADYLQPRLFDPLGMRSPLWQASPRGITLGASGLQLSTRDLAMFGQLYLQDGVWDGQRLLPEGWVADASHAHVANGDTPEDDWSQGYGYQLWRCQYGAYRADGAFGQMSLILPEQDAVIAITSGSPQLKPTLLAIWEHLLPGMNGPLAESPVSHYALQGRLARLALPTPRTISLDPAIAAVIADRPITLTDNDLRVQQMTFTFASDCIHVTLRDQSGKEEIIHCGRTDWVVHDSSLWRYEEPLGSVKLAAIGGWLDDSRLTMRLQYTQMPFHHTITFDFSKPEVDIPIHMELNLPFWVPRSADLIGTLVPSAR